MYILTVQTLLRHVECSSARSNRDDVVAEMKRALDMIHMVVTDSAAGGDAQTQSPMLSVNAADSGISLSLLQTTAFRAIKDFEVCWSELIE